jgi:uncharacterized protein YkwD
MSRFNIWSALALMPAAAILGGCGHPSQPVGRESACTQAAAGLAAMQRGVAAEINLARTQPAAYASLVQSHFSSLDTRGVYQVSGRLIQTNEGRAAVDEAIAFLRSALPREPLALDTCLSAAAQGHADDLGKRGARGHTGSDGSSPSDRATRHLGFRPSCGENIGYGLSSERAQVIAMIVDDGVASRGHRDNLFATHLEAMGIGLAQHATYGQVAVHLLCKGGG